MTHIPDGWQNVTLGSFCEFMYGKSLPAGQRDGGEFRVYGSNGPVGTHSQAITRGPAVVVGRKGSFGEIHYSSESCWPIDTTYFVDESATSADLKWLSYLLSTLGLTEMNRAAAIPGLNREDAYAKSVLLPSLPEQKRIAAILDAVDALRAKRREAIALLGDLSQSVFLDRFGDPARNPLGWPAGKVGDLLISANYGSSAKAGMEGEVPMLRMGNVTASGDVDVRDLKYLPKGQVSEKHLVRAGDVLFNRTNSAELVGKTAIYRFAEEVAYAGYLVRLRVNEENNPEYLAAFLNSRYAKRVLRLMSKSIVGMANINAKEIQGMKIPIPPLAEQKRFAAAVTQVEAAKEPHRAHLAVLDELFISLQHRAFSGALWDHEATGEAA